MSILPMTSAYISNPMTTLLYMNSEAGITIKDPVPVSPGTTVVPPFVGMAGPVIYIGGSA